MDQLQKRLDLHAVLKAICPNAYFQPPGNVVMQYPCIVYARDAKDIQYADNLPYFRKTRYSVTVIDRDPDSSIPERVADLPMSSFERHYVADNLNHDVYNLFF